MLSSNIHLRELNNDGHWVRLIPSLNGGLYKFDGNNLEPVPITTDQLLRSSFRYSDDLIFSGGKETRSYGISTLTGQILYQCNISGCTNNTEGDSLANEKVLLVQRFQQTVRAIKPRSGLEKWNFSVGQHELMLMPQENEGCNDRTRQITRDIELRVVVPEGLVWAINKSNPQIKLWQYKFDSPIVSIWRDDFREENSGALKEVDLFDGSQWTWGSEFSTSPAIYVGMHDTQLYVQENTDLTKIVEHSRRRSNEFLKFPWRPYPAVETAVAITGDKTSDNYNGNEESHEIVEATSITALSVLYNSKYINGNGFYLYPKFDSSSQCNGTNPNVIVGDNISQSKSLNNENIEEEEDETPVQVIIVSLWYWWKEVVIISVTTAVLLNWMLTQRFLNERTPTKEAGFPPVIVETHVEIKKEPSVNSDAVDGLDFKSRYRSDFEHIDCLGKGGYGVVFEAKNKIDDCNYAIKRICLPNSKDSRDRVMREVKALAKLEHQNIVRYFNAWLECPPVGWQEKQDEIYLADHKLSSSEFPSEYTQSVPKPNSSIFIEVPQSEASSVDSAFEAFELNTRYSKSDDSFIVFEASSTEDESAVTEEIGNFSNDETSSETENSKTSEKSNHQSTHDDETGKSDSVVFRHSGSNKLSEKESLEKRKASFSLQLNKKNAVRKSAKMFLYIQMQLCQKLSLREWLKRQPQTRNVSRIVNIFQQIVDAVEYVHLQGLIHRDLKPSNIFFAYDEKIKIGDFGLVTAMTEGYDDALRTPDGERSESTIKSHKNGLHTACVGTHLYMSPEQMNGQIYNYKVDIYSLGIILFELLIPFFTEMERIDALMNLRKSIFPQDFAEKHPEEYKLLKMMLDENPMNRPTTLGIKARRPLSNENDIDNGTGDVNKWHFELPQISRHSSVTNSSASGESWDKVETVH
ncbi:eukaryotic translation initiation factor 2-alpha kinase isoform X2 [Venturia canescens]|nr:eukaryotic translation initiation factor 2-alpha kinase isoform X2 [Venturia canescens]